MTVGIRQAGPVVGVGFKIADPDRFSIHKARTHLGVTKPATSPSNDVALLRRVAGVELRAIARGNLAETRVLIKNLRKIFCPVGWCAVGGITDRHNLGNIFTSAVTKAAGSQRLLDMGEARTGRLRTAIVLQRAYRLRNVKGRAVEKLAYAVRRGVKVIFHTAHESLWRIS